ncbi:hypothetical protein SAMN05444285_12453 [Draconibacterium orientale]|jgi:hypothetical protein|uniref:Uncharacterized protein n=1 Tax=Draconibacterium orientale TaxID=1168034 RepID=X5DLC2_9BACT|nr:hypothetical protein [Draconibacterium orientale]AHW62049.1 hypothetical protein FH5T_13985 [Draconibacterium orientale]SET81747.1 hypothetical protein SAMN05444285_12453 [Draconibacterium orientale]
MNITSLTKKQVAKSIVPQLEEQAYEMSLQTGLLKNYSPSSPITTQTEDNGFIPDIITTEKNGETNIYEIQLNNNINTEKWSFFAHFTKERHGKLHIIVPEPNLSAAEKVIVENDIRNVSLMYVPN